jgi:hypothetical protein
METLTNPEQIEIYNFLGRFPNQFVSVPEISKHVGNRKRFNEDRNWARPTLRRMEMEGWLESNSFAEYRIKRRPEDTATFLKAMHVPGMDLGETSIIFADDVKESLDNSPDTAPRLKSSAD